MNTNPGPRKGDVELRSCDERDDGLLSEPTTEAIRNAR